MTYGTSYDEDSLFFSLDPLNDLVGAFSQGVPISVRTSNAVKFEHWCHPSK